MRIERMVLDFRGMDNVIVDHEEHLKNYDLNRLSNISVRVAMKSEEFAAFREWKAQFEPPRPAVVEKPKVAEASEYEKYSY
jgi:hypothetical protein